MKRVAHTFGGTGFFDQLDTAALEAEIQKVVDAPADFFSIEQNQTGDSQIFWRLIVATSSESIEFEVGELCEMQKHMTGNDWENAVVNIGHGRRTQRVGFLIPPTPQDEQIRISIDRAEGSLEIQCRLRDVGVSRRFAEGLHASLKLSDKPVKFSRDIPQSLETKLLCDSLHMCNICREEGVIIHHMKPVEDGGRTTEENLIVLCLKHHRQAHSRSELSKNLSSVHLVEYKKRHRAWVESRGSGEAYQISETDAD